MSPRIKRPRKVLSPPIIKEFKPIGPGTDDLNPEPVYMLFEEYKALRQLVASRNVTKFVSGEFGMQN